MIDRIIQIYRDLQAEAYTLLLARCFYSIGKKSKINAPLRFANLSQISLGQHVTVHSDCWIQALQSKMSDNQEPKIQINDYSSIGMGATISAIKSIVIEEYVFTARNVYISDHEHKYDDISQPIAHQHIGKIAPVRIGAHTWLGQNAVVLPGVTIGKHCVIGANAVVNKDIPDFSVAAGVPAKVIKRYDPALSRWIRV